MNNSMIKLKGRGYLIGNLPLLTLLILSLWVFSLCLNILPEALMQLLSELPEKSRSFAVAVASVAVIFVLLFLFSLFDMGLHRFFLRKAEHRGGKVNDLFYYFSPSRSIGAFTFIIKYTLMKTGLFFLCFLPFFISLNFLFRLIKTSASLSVTAVMLLTVMLLFVNGCIFAFALKSSLFLVKYYYVNGVYLNFRHLISTSQHEMQNHKKSFLKLELSFVGWFFSCLFIFPIVYVLLYNGQSKAVLAAEIMSE